MEPKTKRSRVEGTANEQSSTNAKKKKKKLRAIKLRLIKPTKTGNGNPWYLARFKGVGLHRSYNDGNDSNGSSWYPQVKKWKEPIVLGRMFEDGDEHEKYGGKNSTSKAPKERQLKFTTPWILRDSGVGKQKMVFKGSLNGTMCICRKKPCECRNRESCYIAMFKAKEEKRPTMNIIPLEYEITFQKQRNNLQYDDVQAPTESLQVKNRRSRYMNKLKGDFGNTLTSSGTGVPENSSGNSGNMESGETNKEDDWDNVLDGCGTAYMQNASDDEEDEVEDGQDGTMGAFDTNNYSSDSSDSESEDMRASQNSLKSFDTLAEREQTSDPDLMSTAVSNESVGPVLRNPIDIAVYDIMIAYGKTIEQKVLSKEIKKWCTKEYPGLKKEERKQYYSTFIESVRKLCDLNNQIWELKQKSFSVNKTTH